MKGCLYTQDVPVFKTGISNVNVRVTEFVKDRGLSVNYL